MPAPSAEGNTCIDISHHHDHIDDSLDALLKTAMAEYREKQAATVQMMGKSKWSCDLDNCLFTLERENQKRSWNVTPIATYLPEQQSWVWVWANDVYSELARERSAQLKALADKTQYKIFVSAQVPLDLAEVDELCALALHELQADFVFKNKNTSKWLLRALKAC